MVDTAVLSSPVMQEFNVEFIAHPTRRYRTHLGVRQEPQLNRVNSELIRGSLRTAHVKFSGDKIVAMARESDSTLCWFAYCCDFIHVRHN